MPLPLVEDPAYRELKQRAAHYEKVTGAQGFLYPSAPGGRGEPVRFVFGDVVRFGLRSALA